MKIICVIPARYNSSRLEGKILIDILGKTMIQRVYEQVLQSKYINKIIVATDDARIFNEVINFGGQAVMTSISCKTGSDRIAEAISHFPEYDIVVNVQGDEPFINPQTIDNAIEPLLNDNNLNISTVYKKITDLDEINNPNVVKIVKDQENNIIYFSRATIPYNREKIDNIIYYKHIGLYVYRREFLLQYTKWNTGTLENIEKLEQLRILEHGYKIRGVETEFDTIGIDTKKDLEKAIFFLKNKY